MQLPDAYVSIGKLSMEKLTQSKESDNPVNILIRELAIPFLGSLVPGTYLWLGIIFSIVPPIALLLGVFTLKTSSDFDLLMYLSTIIQNVKSGSWFLFIVIAYVLGAIVSKQDPKITDQRSFARISSQLNKTDGIKETLACTILENCEYPYPNLSDYIEKCGLNHLLPLIPWRENPRLKSKAYINKLKLHIELRSPTAYRTLVRNEAHIRLTNTVWHSSILIRYCCVFGFFVILISSIFTLANQNAIKSLYANIRYILSAAVFPAFVLLISEFIRINIEKVFHWQRLRELFFIFETYFKLYGDQGEKC